MSTKTGVRQKYNVMNIPIVILKNGKRDTQVGFITKEQLRK